MHIGSIQFDSLNLRSKARLRRIMRRRGRDSLIDFLDTPKAVSDENGFVTISQQVRFQNIADEPADVNSLRHFLDKTRFFLHWGRYGAGSAEWRDEELSADEIVQVSENQFKLTRVVKSTITGDYGATFYCVRDNAGRHKIWSGAPWEDDAKFRVGSNLPAIPQNVSEYIQQSLINIEDLVESSRDFEKFLRFVAKTACSNSIRDLGPVLFDVSSKESLFKSRLAALYQTAKGKRKRARASLRKKHLDLVISSIENLGIGELVMVAPEGPHAASGGLAHVISGLGESLSKNGVPVTLITPLYEKNQGNRHKSAAQLIKTGIKLCGKRVPLSKAGSISVEFGPTYYSGTKVVKEFGRNVCVQVYKAEHGKFRIFFLRHKELAPALYAEAPSDEQLRRAIFLSIGALELMGNAEFGINPHVIITNDWQTGLLPVYLKLGDSYKANPVFQSTETVHILHNAGRSYQGLLYTNQFGEDLWPLLGLEGEHFFGLADPKDHRFLNLTAGAVKHVSKAVVAVSRPYAEQLCEEQTGEGLHDLFTERADILYGISNGINWEAIARLVWKMGQAACSLAEGGGGDDCSGVEGSSKELCQIPDESSFSEKMFVANLPSYKLGIKSELQAEYALKKDENAILASLIGRLAEQKGISLLTASLNRGGPSLLECLLQKYPGLQIIVGGPVSATDVTGIKLVEELTKLEKVYQGRVRGIFEFVSHHQALKITAGSDLFLMPSRYEPGGISQLEALAVGTSVVARNVGGLGVTLEDCFGDFNCGDSFLFNSFTVDSLFQSIVRALDVIEDDELRVKLVKRAASSKHDWTSRTDQYLALLQHLLGIFPAESETPFLDKRKELISQIRPDISAVRPVA